VIKDDEVAKEINDLMLELYRQMQESIDAGLQYLSENRAHYHPHCPVVCSVLFI